MKKLSLMTTAALLALTGCKEVVFTGVTEAGLAAAEERTFGEVVDDGVIYAGINHRYLETDVNDLLPNVNIMVRQGRVLLSGKVDQEITKKRAVEETWKVAGVQEVIDEIVVQPDRRVIDRANDEWIEKQVEAKLAITKGVNILNYSVEVSDGRVMLLGMVQSEQELKNVFAIVRRVKGVKEVVSHLRLGNVVPVPVGNSGYTTTPQNDGW
jgi:osmotically-inducible protein OsmY